MSERSRATADDATATLAALRTLRDDPSLPDATRDLLARTEAALIDARIRADTFGGRCEALFNAVPDPVLLLDAEGRVVDANAAAVALFGGPRERFAALPLQQLLPDLPSDAAAPVQGTIARGEAYTIEASARHADGHRVAVEVHAAGAGCGTGASIVMVLHDLDRRRASELRYRSLVELIDQGVAIHGADGRVLHANAAALRMFDVPGGHSIDEVWRPERWLIIDEGGRELAGDELPARVARRSGTTVSGCVLGFYDRARGRLRWLSVTAVPQFAPGGGVEQVLSLFSDVTALKRDSVLFDRAQALAHIGGWEWDAALDRLYLTDEAKRILDREPVPESLAGLLASLRDSDRQDLRAAFDAALAHGTPVDLEVNATHGAGRSVWMRIIGEADASRPLRTRLSGTVQDITDRKQDEETRRVQSRTDPLTGLLNRDAIMKALQDRVDDTTQRSVAVLYVDLDRFRTVNDVLGHAAGDRLLAAASRRLEQAVGSEGLIGRFGGDEFLVVCNTGDDPSRPQRLAQDILGAFALPFPLDAEQFNVTASVGVARAGVDAASAPALIQNADAAMHDSKRRGRNTWQPFTPELAERQQQRLQLANHLWRAIDNGEFRLVYQPQVELATGRTIGVEALIRWRNQSLGEMRPDHFIGHAEATGEILGIGSWSLREACRQMREWLDRGVALERMAVNVSYRQFLGEDLAASVRALLGEYRLPGHALELEFTERVLIEDVPDTLRTFAELRDLGVTLTIDDFGEGYSALDYLRRLPVHGLKVSQLFVRGVPDDRSDVAICQAITGVARGLGLDMVAEGIENERQRVFLRDLGVRVGQGYLFAAGLQPEEIEARCGRLPTPTSAP